MRIRTKRIYEPVEESDGRRVLVDGIWPRGVRKQSAQLEVWARELAPSPELRRWYGHDPARWQAFRRRYFHELEGRPREVQRLLERQGTLTLLYGAADREHNNAVALQEYLQQRAKEAKT